MCFCLLFKRPLNVFCYIMIYVCHCHFPCVDKTFFQQNRWSKSGKNVPLFHFDYIFIKILNFYILSTNQVVLFISLFEFKSVFNIHTSFVFKENTYGHTKANWWWLSHQRKITASVTPKHGATWRPNKSHGDCHIKAKKSLKIPKG
jgi:hypothetical protein